MKKIILAFFSLLVMIAAIIFVLPAPDQSAFPSAKVFIFAGQSNMVGYGQKKNSTDKIGKIPDNIFLWNSKSQSFHRLKDSKNTNFGPELGFALHPKTSTKNENIYLIKIAFGDTSLHVDWKPNSGKLFKSLQNKTRASLKVLKAQGLSPKVQAFFWMQGERDAKITEEDENNIPQMALMYERNLEVFIKTIRKDFGDKTYFILGRIHKKLEEAKPSQGIDFRGTKLVREAQNNIAQKIKNVAIIDTDEFALKADKVHFNEEGQLALGHEFAKSWLEFNDPR